MYLGTISSSLGSCETVRQFTRHCSYVREEHMTNHVVARLIEWRYTVGLFSALN